jgi:hypothetical protein
MIINSPCQFLRFTSRNQLFQPIIGIITGGKTVNFPVLKSETLYCYLPYICFTTQLINVILKRFRFFSSSAYARQPYKLPSPLIWGHSLNLLKISSRHSCHHSIWSNLFASSKWCMFQKSNKKKKHLLTHMSWPCEWKLKQKGYKFMLLSNSHARSTAGSTTLRLNGAAGGKKLT